MASCMIASGFRAALDLETYPLSNFIRLRRAERAKPGRGKPVIIKIGCFACIHARSLERSRCSKIATLFFMPLFWPCSTEAVNVSIAHKSPRSL